MTRPFDENDLRKYLTPFADGELEVEQSLRVLEHMAMNPQATRRVMHQQQLRQAISRHLADRTPAAPVELKQRLEALFPAPVVAPAPRARRWWIAPLMAGCGVAILLLGIWIGRSMPQQQPRAPVTPTTTASAGQIPPTLVATLTRTHVNCSRFAQHYDKRLFPVDLGELPPAIKKYLGHNGAAPDLRQIGYRFIGAEPCPIPGAKTVHILYRANGSTNIRDTVSIFMQPDEGQLDITPDRVYPAGDQDSAHPGLVWRTSGMVYYVVGNAIKVVNETAKLTGAPI